MRDGVVRAPSTGTGPGRGTELCTPCAQTGLDGDRRPSGPTRASCHPAPGDVARTTITPLTCPDAASSTVHTPHHRRRPNSNITMGRREAHALGSTEGAARTKEPHLP